MTSESPRGGPLMVYCIAVHDETYPRNRELRRQLEVRGHTVRTVPRPGTGEYLRESFAIARGTLALARKFGRPDVVIVSEFALQFAPLAYLLSRLLRARLVVDAFVGLVETNVEDYGEFSLRSVRGRLHALLDWMAVRLADMVLIDTYVRATRLRQRNGLVRVLPVGAPDWATPAATTRRAGSQIRVLYYGNYIPLHGLGVVHSALLRMPDVSATFVGSGDRRDAFRANSKADNITYVDAVPEAALAELIWDHDVILGVFGSSPKAQSVIANKVWQALACGRTVVTRESPALDEIRALVPAEQLITIEPEAGALVAALRTAAPREGSDVATFAESDAALRSYCADHFEKFVSDLGHIVRT